MATKTRTVTRYVRAPRRRGGGKKFTLPVAVIAGLVPTVSGVYARRSSLTEMGRFVTQAWTGYDPGGSGWQASYLRWGAMPALLGFAAHGLASKLGINRAIARAGIPIFRI